MPKYQYYKNAMNILNTSNLSEFEKYFVFIPNHVDGFDTITKLYEEFKYDIIDDTYSLYKSYFPNLKDKDNYFYDAWKFYMEYREDYTSDELSYVINEYIADLRLSYGDKEHKNCLDPISYLYIIFLFVLTKKELSDSIKQKLMIFNNNPITVFDYGKNEEIIFKMSEDEQILYQHIIDYLN